MRGTSPIKPQKLERPYNHSGPVTAIFIPEWNTLALERLIRLSVCLSVCLSVRLSFCLTVHPSASPPARPPVRLYVQRQGFLLFEIKLRNDSICSFSSCMLVVS